VGKVAHFLWSIVMQVIKLNAASQAQIVAVYAADRNREAAINTALPVLRKQFANCDREAIKATVQIEYAHHAGIELRMQSTGRVVWPKDDPRVGSVKRACNHLITAILADDVKREAPEEVEVDASLLALARKLAKASGMDRKACAKALAMAFAK
jgi:hypothetical protein